MSGFTVTTKAARKKYAQAHATGSAVPKITQVGWGSGGHSADNSPVQPADTLTAVPGEFYRNTPAITMPGDTTVRYNLTLAKPEGNTGVVSSCGLYDAAGTLIAVKNFSPKIKDDEVEILITWDEEF